MDNNKEKMQHKDFNGFEPARDGMYIQIHIERKICPHNNTLLWLDENNDEG